MTQEEKELLFKDLCARLPYRPIVHAKWSYRETDGTIKHNKTDRKLEINDFYAIWDVRPYLRPMSSMTEEELDEYEELEWSGDFKNLSIPLLDWLNKHHFDYRGLIEEGLALEAPKDMYKI